MYFYRSVAIISITVVLSSYKYNIRQRRVVVCHCTFLQKGNILQEILSFYFILELVNTIPYILTVRMVYTLQRL